MENWWRSGLGYTSHPGAMGGEGIDATGSRARDGGASSPCSAPRGDIFYDGRRLALFRGTMVRFDHFKPRIPMVRQFDRCAGAALCAAPARRIYPLFHHGGAPLRGVACGALAFCLNVLGGASCRDSVCQYVSNSVVALL